MRSGAALSTVFHVMILLVVYFGMPSLFSIDDPVERVVPVAVYPVREETVMPPPQPRKAEPDVQEAEEAEPEPAKEPVPMPPDPDVADVPPPPPPPEPVQAEPEPAPRVAEAAPPPPPTIPERSFLPPPPPPKPKPVQVAKKKKPPPEPELKPEPKEKPPQPDLLASLLKSVVESAQKAIKLDRKKAEAAPVPPPPEPVMTMSNVSDEPLSASVSDAIRRQVEEKWNVPAGAAGAADLAVEIRIRLLPDGEVQRAEIVDKARLAQSNEVFFRTMAESARRAVLQASPLRDLPPAKYEQWREITFTFRPPV